jgi:hypothetical protein
MFKKVSDLIHREFSYSTMNVQSSYDYYQELSRLAGQWSNILGPFIGEHSLPVKIKKKALLVLTTHPLMAHEFAHLERDIYLKIVQAFPRLSTHCHEIKFSYEPSFSVKEELAKMKMQASEEKERDPATALFIPNFTKMAQEEKNSLIEGMNRDDLYDYWIKLLDQH